MQPGKRQVNSGMPPVNDFTRKLFPGVSAFLKRPWVVFPADQTGCGNGTTLMTASPENHQAGAIDPDTMRRVEDVIKQLRWTYIRDWAPAAIEELETASSSLCRAVAENDSATAGANQDAILRLTHDMKGQAGTFGLELLQDFAASLHHFAQSENHSKSRQADLCRAHVTAMRTALSDVSSHPDGALDTHLEQELLNGLRRLAQMGFN